MAEHNIQKKWTPKRQQRRNPPPDETMNSSRQYAHVNHSDPPDTKTVSGMPWIDSEGDTGFYTGDVNQSNLPHGTGMMRYDDGPIVKGRWKEGEMAIEEEEEETEETENNIQQQQQQQQPSSNNYASSSGGLRDDEDSKERVLQEFHERNQQFLQQTQGQYQQQAMQYQQQQQAAQLQYEQQQQREQQYDEDHLAETEELHKEIYQLQEQVHQLSHELRITQDTHQLNRDQSRAEIEMLHTELDRQNSRHEHIVASLRNRLVESEMARMKMQDQLSTRMEEDYNREEELKSRWSNTTTRVLEDKKWVDEQMNYWKESMEEHRRRLNGAKERGGLDAQLGGTGGGGDSASSNGLRSRGGSHDSEDKCEETLNRRLAQRRLWGASEEGEEEDSDEEEMRLFGSMTHGA